MTGVLIKRPHEDIGTERHRGRSHVMPEAEAGVIQLQARDCQPPPEAKKEAWNLEAWNSRFFR